MQIEFYLPLPSDGFLAALIIYYMAGLLVFMFYMWRYATRTGLRGGAAGVMRSIKAVNAFWMVIGAMVWPVIIASYRNR